MLYPLFLFVADLVLGSPDGQTRTPPSVPLAMSDQSWLGNE